MKTKDILRKPIITERSLHEAGRGWFTFKVVLSATKPQIKDAIEKQFDVSVLTVRTMIVKGKTKRVGKKRQEIVQSAFKKALVKLPEGQKIDLFEVST